MLVCVCAASRKNRWDARLSTPNNFALSLPCGERLSVISSPSPQVASLQQAHSGRVAQSLEYLQNDAERKEFGTGLVNFDRTKVFYFGIIDILTKYNMKKRMEHGLKSMGTNRKGISAVSPHV